MVKQLPSNYFRMAIWCIPLTVLAMVPGISDPINAPKLFALFSCALTSASLFGFEVLSKRKSFRFGGVGVFLFSVLGIVMVVAGFLSTPNISRLFLGSPGRNNGLIFYLSLVVICVVVLSTQIGEREITYASRWIAITVGIFAGYCTLQYFDLDPVNWVLPFNRVIGSLGNPNFSAAFLGVSGAVSFFLALIANPKIRSMTISFWLLGAVFSALAWTTGSLQGILIAFVGLIISTSCRLHMQFSSFKLFVFMVLSGVGCIIFMLFSFLGLGPLGQTLEQYTLKLRLAYTSIGIQAILDHPLFGIGVDSYNLAFRQYRSPELIEQYGIELNADNAHSVPIQIGSSFGVVVLFLYLAIQILILLRALHFLFQSPSQNPFVRAMSLGWILLFIQSFLSIEIIGLATVNWILGALILSFDKDRSKPSERHLISKRKLEEYPVWSTPSMILVFLLSVIPYALFVREDAAFRFLVRSSSLEFADSLKVREAFERLTIVTLLEPVKVGQVLPLLAKMGYSDEINETSSNLYNSNSEDPIAVEVKAATLEVVGDISGAILLRQKLRELDPLNYRYELTLATLLAKAGQIEQLKESLRLIRAHAPEGSSELNRARELEKEFIQS